MLELIKDLWAFLGERNKLWMATITPSRINTAALSW